MHELPATQGICDLVVREAERLGARRVCKIVIKMGRCMDYVPEILQTYFDALSEGTIAEGARLEVDYIPVRISCHSCGEESSSDHYISACPKCGSRDTNLMSGREFYVENMEIEDGD